jgi:hypothetical protein
MSKDFSVQSTMEPYLKSNDPSGACYGVVSKVYLPPAQLVNPLLAPMQSPFVVQTLIEQKLQSDLFSNLPVWLSRECEIALRKFFCGTSLMQPELQNIGQVFQANGIPIAAAKMSLPMLGINKSFVDHSFYLPSYPHRKVCENYQTQCASFIQASGLAALIPNCTKHVSSGSSILMYPEKGQTIVQLPLPSLSKVIQFTTQPNVNASDPQHAFLFQTNCPPGFVVPDNKDDKDVIWIPGSGCALSCRYNRKLIHFEN